MISTLRGQIQEVSDDFIVLDVNGIGFKVNVSFLSLSKIKKEEKIKLYTYLHVRENILALYGFLDSVEAEFFEILIGISGIGPKAGLKILNAVSVEELKQAISSGNTSILTKISGIGKKMADKITLELKNKIEPLSKTKYTDQTLVDALDALIKLGYSSREAREALQDVSKSAKTTEDKVKWALKNLGKS